MKISLSFALLVLLSFGIYAQHTNIMISDTLYPEEPSICINPKNTNDIVAGSNIDNVFHSTDGGHTWAINKLYSAPYGVWGDPCIAVDTTGAFYFFHLSNPPGGNWIDRIVCQRLDTVGGQWTTGTYMGLNGTKAQDKEWAVVDRATNTIYVTWTQFDQYGSSNPADSSIIRFSKSTDRGDTWSPAKRINKIAGDCIDSDNTVEGAVPAMGPNGAVYVSWAGPEGIVFDRSLDGGDTWLDHDIFVADQPGGWDFNIPGISRCNGLPVTCCDISNGPYKGNIYINWSDQRNGTTDTDIWFVKSADGGNSWTNPMRVNDDPPGKHQFFTWMTVDQVTGYIYLVFYDRRAYNDSQTDVYMAVSKNGGDSFVNFKISDTPFLPINTVFFGDYNNIDAHNNVVRPMWTRLHNGDLSVWTAIIDTLFLGVDQQDHTPFTLEQAFPNPFQFTSYFTFKLHETSIISLDIIDVHGRVVETCLNNVTLSPGKYIEEYHAKNIANGTYFFRFICNGQTTMQKIVYQN